MAYNNTIYLTGNMGSEAELTTTENGPMAAFSLATTDSYLDEKDEWQQKETVWHKVLVFSPRLIEEISSLKKGTRIQLLGSMSYRPFQTTLDDGRVVTKKEASVVGHKVELKPLVKSMD